jgi:hypothetical protein
MDRAQVLFPISSLDPRRIAATSGAIAVHVAVLMLLMMPMRTAPSTPIPETPTIFEPEFKEIPLIPDGQAADASGSGANPVGVAPATARPPRRLPPPMPPDTRSSKVSSRRRLPFAQISADVAPPPYPRRYLRIN